MQAVDSIQTQTPEKTSMKQNPFPPGWDSNRVAKVLAHYEPQTEDEALFEDEAAFEMDGQTMMEVPTVLVPAVRELLAKHNAA